MISSGTHQVFRSFGALLLSGNVLDSHALSWGYSSSSLSNVRNTRGIALQFGVDLLRRYHGIRLAVVLLQFLSCVGFDPLRSDDEAFFLLG